MTIYMKKITKYIPLPLNIAIIVFGIIGFKMNMGYGTDTLRYYTVLSNLFALITSAVYVVWYIVSKGKLPVFITYLRYTATVCLTLTFLVVTFVFVPMSGNFKVLLEGVNLYQHLLCPAISFVSFLFFENKERLAKRHVFLSLIPTFTYAAVILVLNILRVVVGPYPFLMVYKQSAAESVMWFFIINGMALATASLLMIPMFVRKKKSGVTDEN